MLIQKLLNEFDCDTDFVADLLFTIGNESKQYLECLQNAVKQKNHVVPSELQRIAHLMKPMANIIGLFERSTEADAIEQRIATFEPDSNEQQADVKKLISIATEIHNVAQVLLREIDT